MVLTDNYICSSEEKLTTFLINSQPFKFKLKTFIQATRDHLMYVNNLYPCLFPLLQ